MGREKNCTKADPAPLSELIIEIFFVFQAFGGAWLCPSSLHLCYASWSRGKHDPKDCFTRQFIVDSGCKVQNSKFYDEIIDSKAIFWSFMVFLYCMFRFRALQLLISLVCYDWWESELPKHRLISVLMSSALSVDTFCQPAALHLWLFAVPSINFFSLSANDSLFCVCAQSHQPQLTVSSQFN